LVKVNLLSFAGNWVKVESRSFHYGTPALYFEDFGLPNTKRRKNSNFESWFA
jgi:hypothetical protein